MKTSRYTERVRRDAATLVEDTGDLMRAAGEDLHLSMKHAGDRVCESLENVKDSCGEACKQASRWARKTEKVIQQHPYEALLAALVLGLLGAWIGTRRS